MPKTLKVVAVHHNSASTFGSIYFYRLNKCIFKNILNRVNIQNDIELFHITVYFRIVTENFVVISVGKANRPVDLTREELVGLLTLLSLTVIIKEPNY